MKKIVYILLLLFVSNALAQLSPGDLSLPHQDLEGLTNCTKCHEFGEKVAADKCLACHTILKDRINYRKGLHTNKNYKQCGSCHSDHHGRKYKLIFWEKGQDAFDHKTTGYELQGKHKSTACRDCHIEKNIQNGKVLIQKKKDLNRTFFGLNQNCLSCHHDEHRGQMDTTCLNCHNMLGWNPALQFDHNHTKFPLTGLHKKVECKECHVSIEDNEYEKDKSYLTFSGLKFQQCLDCHRDPHQNRFGAKCETCHNTTGWKNYARNKFNHAQTRYPLKGKHEVVACEKCHGTKKSKKIAKFNHCTDCHSDYHAGQFEHRRQKGACKECHSVYGFSPAKFTIEDHQSTHYPLQGAHLAIPCIACHQEETIHSVNTIRFKFRSTLCMDCHRNPHKNHVNKYLKTTSSITYKTGCEHCHNINSWNLIVFNHDITNYSLYGKHLHTPCVSCHKPSHINNRLRIIPFSGQSGICLSCHDDVHMGQFTISIETSSDKKTTNCERCHTPTDFHVESFDHNKQSRYKLQGAHANVKCNECHKVEIINGIKFVRYKPISTECRACHAKTFDN